MTVVLMLLLLAETGALFVLCRKHAPPAREREAALRREEVEERRTELYELLLYARKMYRETGEPRFLMDIKTVQGEISDCEKALRALPAEQ